MSAATVKSTTGKSFYLAQVIFCVSGVGNNLIGYYIDLHGAGTTILGYEALSTVLGQVFLALLISFFCGQKLTKEDFTRPFRLWWLILCDLIANASYWTGLSYIGSQLCTIVYSSVLIWSAVFSKVLYQKPISLIKWLAIVIILISLSVSTMDQVETAHEAPELQILGCGFILLSATAYGLEYVLNEDALLKVATPMAGSVFFWPNLVMLGLWSGVNTGFGYEKQLIDPIEKADGTPIHWQNIVGLYLAFTLVNGVHMISFMYTLNGGTTTAAVASAVNKSLQSAITFVTSDLLFCPDHSWNKGRRGTSQLECFTTLKIIGLIGTIFGVTVYSLEALIYTKLLGRAKDPGHEPLLPDKDPINAEKANAGPYTPHNV